MRAGYGYADAAYRPPSLPFASVIGPLSVVIEPICDTRSPEKTRLLTPGHIIGHARPTGQVVRSGALRLRFDGTTTVTIPAIEGRELLSAGDGAAVAESIALALSTAVELDRAVGPEGQPVSATRKAELARATVRWDSRSRRFAIASGLRGAVSSGEPSSVEVLPAPGLDIASDLGLLDAAPVDGRMFQHELAVPRAMLVDVRVELWAAAQTQLAAAVDDLTRIFPGRGTLLTAPALLADDLQDGASTVRLLHEGEPIGRHAWLLVEAQDSLRDRAGTTVLTPTGAADVTPARIRFDAGTGALTGTVSPAPLVPSPLEVDRLAPRGLALSIGFAFANTPAAGQSVRLMSLMHLGVPVIDVTISFAQPVVAPPNGAPPELQAEIKATATLEDANGARTTAVTRWRVSSSRLVTPVQFHATVVAAKGTVQLFLDGEAQPANTGPAPVGARGAPFTGNDMILTLGEPAGSPGTVDVTFVRLFSEPVGPSDPQLRKTPVSAAQWPPGSVLQLARSDDGVTLGAPRFATKVESVEGDSLRVFPPVAGAWERGRTIVFGDEYFLKQEHFRRKDDLVNSLYRASAEYRVSALLRDEVGHPAVQLVEEVSAEVSARQPAPQTVSVGI